MGRLERKLDVDLIDRIDASGPQGGKKRTTPIKYNPRPANTYRGYKRNLRRKKPVDIDEPSNPNWRSDMGDKENV